MNLKKLFLFGFLMVLGVLKGGEPVQASLSGVLKTSGSAHLSLPFNSLSSFLNYFKIAVFQNKKFTINENELSKLITQGKIIKWGALTMSVLATYGIHRILKTQNGVTEVPKNLLGWGKFLTSAALVVLGIYTFTQLSKTRTFSTVK